MNPPEPPNRCRLVLIAPRGIEPARLLSALDGGDVASLILPEWGMDEDAFQSFAEKVVPAAQAEGVAVMIAGDPRIAARAKADGIHVDGSRRDLEDVIAKHQSKLMVGAGGANDRDNALELGEARPDYMFFGRFGHDDKPEPHPRNLKLGRWWAEMIEIPCIVAAGSEPGSIGDVAATGVEFVAASSLVYGDEVDPAAAVKAANSLLDAEAPSFGD